MAVKGFDQIFRKLKELQSAAAVLDGDIASVTFNPNDPQSIELAIRTMEAAIDERVGEYSKNDMVQEIALEMKEHYRQVIVDRAAAERSADGSAA